MRTDKTPDEPRLFISYEITPPFPSFWLPREDSSLYYYLYGNHGAYHMGADLVGTIWGRIEIACVKDVNPKFTRIAEEVRELGVQGVWPLKTEEIDIYRKAESVERYLKNLTEPPDEKSEMAEATRKYYDLWVNCHGVLAGEIRHRHEDFFRWATNENDLVPKFKKKWWPWRK